MACLAEGLKESMQRLQVDYIDIFQCHDIEFRSLDQVSQHVKLRPLQLTENRFVSCLSLDATVALADDLQHLEITATLIVYLRRMLHQLGEHDCWHLIGFL